ncbi:protein TIFY 9 [Pyrus x bretschneideri]|uniref:protein TIFY 9 n=1 Tax=Pyrus x bretschneideri TaxID=225117 RepID=UPI0020303220|nr:protein TIFY 9 [Pyrus x bretschneideri]
MSRPTVELDFFGMDQHHRDAPSSSSSSKSQFQKFLHRPKSFRGIHTAMSKINPEAFKSVIASGDASPSVPNPGKSFSVPSSPKAEQVPFSSLPLYVPTGTSVSSFTAAASESLQETKPLTIFYNGTVSVFDVHRDQVDGILKLALQGNSGKAAEASVAVDPKLAFHPSEQHQTQQLVDPRDKVDSILKLALEGNSGKAAEAPVAVDPKLAFHPSEQHQTQQLVDPLSGYLPISRNKSLQRFLEKRKERMNSGSPYACQT